VPGHGHFAAIQPIGLCISEKSVWLQIAVTVLGGDAFTKANVSGFSDLSKFATARAS
jgi:hypothetical protein